MEITLKLSGERGFQLPGTGSAHFLRAPMVLPILKAHHFSLAPICMQYRNYTGY